MRLALASSIALAVLAAERPADACSVTRTFMAPTNYELVATTPRIVVAKAVDAVVPARKNAGDDYRIVLETVAAIKGAGKPGERITVRGATTRYMGASKKHDFSRARPGAYAGSCTAWDYKLGKHYLVFLDQYGGKWDTQGIPFARVNEEVEPKNDPWTFAVTTYAKIAALPSFEDRKQALEALTKKTATPTDKAIAADVEAHFGAATPYKSFAELDAMYRAAATPEGRNHIALAIGVSGDQAARAFMKELVTALRSGASHVDQHIALTAIGAYYTKVSDPPVLAQVAELYVALGSAAKQQRWDIMWLLIRRGDASHQNVMERALAGADEEEVGRLVEYFMKAPSEKARKEIRRRLGTAFGQQKWEMTIGLAGLGDKDVLAWAQKRIAQKAVKDDDRWVALYAVAVSPLPEANALAGKLVAQGGNDRVVLIQGYEKARHANAEARLAELGKLKLDAEAKTWLERTVASRAAR